MNALAANFWSIEHGSNGLWMALAGVCVFGAMFILALQKAPVKMRLPVVGLFTFVAGAFWVLNYFWPKPFGREADDLPSGAVESVGFWLSDAAPVVGQFSNILTAFLLGLGVYSLVRIHILKIAKHQKDWSFSIVLFLGMFLMVAFGYWDWFNRLDPAAADKLQRQENWMWQQYARDLFFDGFLQQMDAAMFSIIAFYILSAAYRAFRVRSIEATIMLSSALIMLLSLMGAVVFQWDGAVESVTGSNKQVFLSNFTLTEIAQWIRNYLQAPSIRAVEFGIGISALAMGLRLWLSLERPGGGS